MGATSNLGIDWKDGDLLLVSLTIGKPPDQIRYGWSEKFCILAPRANH